MTFFLEIVALVLTLWVPIYWSVYAFRKNILAILALLIYSAYVVWPLILIHELSLNHYLDIQVESYINRGLILDILFMVLFILGYEWVIRKNILRGAQQKNIEVSLIQRFIMILYLIIFFLVYLNNVFAEIDLVGKWLGFANQMTYGVKGLSYYLQNLTDSLIILTLMAYASNVKKRYLVLMVVGVIFFVVPFGFRYRLIYLILGFLALFVYKNQLSAKKILTPLMLIIFLGILVLFLGANRTVIVGQEPTKQFTLKILSVNDLVMQTRGSYVDLGIYQAIDRGDIAHDHGKSFFYYTIIRAIPASYFDGGKKPYPPILMKDVDKVLNLRAPIDCQNCRTGEAQTIMGGIYYSFGASGIAVIAFLLGSLVGFYARNQKHYLSFIWGLCALLALFTFITRGYFPQVIDNWIYLVIPPTFLKIWYFACQFNGKSDHC